MAIKKFESTADDVEDTGLPPRDGRFTPLLFTLPRHRRILLATPPKRSAWQRVHLVSRPGITEGKQPVTWGMTITSAPRRVVARTFSGRLLS